jgi:hypothetical protein
MPTVGETIRRAALVCGVSAAAAFMLPVAALAQQPETAPPQTTVGSIDPVALSADGTEGTEPTLNAEDSALIDKALALDALRYINTPVKPLRRPARSSSKPFDVSGTDRADGSGTVIVKKSLPTEWDAKVGADLGLAANAPSGYNPNNPLHIRRNDSGSGVAWASLSVPQIATVDARVDPRNDQSRLGTTFKRSLPIGRDFAVSLQSGYSVTETMGTSPAGTPDIPLRIAPTGEPTQSTPRVWGNENVAKLDILATGTTLGAGLSSTSTDPVTHNRLSAEQKIYGPLGITTAVTDFGSPGESKSVNARFKLTW